jgi:hypothetical protein
VSAVVSAALACARALGTARERMSKVLRMSIGER